MAQGRVSTAALVADIRRVARLVGRSPSSVEYARHGLYDLTTVRRRFRGTSWAGIISSLGLRYAARSCARIASTGELRRDLARVAGELGRAPTRGEYERLGRFGAEVVRRRSGKRRWEEAVWAVAGFDPEEVKLAQAAAGKGRGYRTTAEWLGKVRALALELGRAPTRGEANAAGVNAHSLCRRVGGGWAEALRRAGVDPARGRPLAALRETPTAEMIEDVRRVAGRLGRAPTMREYAALGRFKPATIASRLGGWKRVKIAIAEGKAPGMSHDSPGGNSLPFFAGTN
jgi:hypothetical protein